MTIYLSKEPVMVTSKTKENIYVLIFKTNIHFKKDLKAIELCLLEQPSVIGWNIDREDVDKVLRIESKHDNADAIISIIKQAGFFCEEL